MIRREPRRNPRRRPAGVSLGNRAVPGTWDDEIRADGGKSYLRRQVRRNGRAEFRKAVARGEV